MGSAPVASGATFWRAAAPRAGPRETMMTSAPPAARCSTVARSMPLLAPVSRIRGFRLVVMWFMTDQKLA